MTKPLRRVALAVLLLLGLLLANISYLQAIQAEELNARPGNARVELREYSRERGPIILDEPGRPELARSVETDDALKYLRRYPEGPLYAHVTGYHSRVYGTEGIERAQSDVLSGRDERILIRRVGDLLAGEEDQRGGSVALTLNPRAQRAAVEGLRGKRGAVVAVEPSSGAILALASSPSYDPNRLASHDRDDVTAAWESMVKDPDQPLLNRALRQTYPPGSTFKLVTAAAALSTGDYTPETEVPGPARIPLPDTRISLPNFDNRPCDPGNPDRASLIQALRRSCNTSFAAVGLDVGDDAMREQAQKFGFGQELRVPMVSAPSVFPDQVNRPQTALSAIGQYDVRTTPLQMALVGAGIANGGVVMKPYLVAEVLGADLSPIDTANPDELGRAVSPQVAAQLARMMVSVVDEGTARNARIPGVAVGGKTGTAQQGGGKPPHAWFVSFAPAESARVAVAVVIEDGGGEQEVSGNRLAAPVARSVMEAVLQR